jgi:hypothetical protein
VERNVAVNVALSRLRIDMADILRFVTLAFLRKLVRLPPVEQPVTLVSLEEGAKDVE